jgi:hypothetical protein
MGNKDNKKPPEDKIPPEAPLTDELPPEEDKASPEKPKEVFRYKHPFKNAPHYFLVQPGAQIVEGKSVRYAGLSIPLINFRFETEDSELRDLIEKDQLFHPAGIERIVGKDIPLKEPTEPAYETGPARVMKKVV